MPLHHTPVCNRANVFEYFFMEQTPVYFLPLAQISMPLLAFPLQKRISFFIFSSEAKKWSLLTFDRQFPMLLFFYVCLIQPEMKRWSRSTRYSAAVEQPLQVMVCYILVVSYDWCVIHHNFSMTYLLEIVVQYVF